MTTCEHTNCDKAATHKSGYGNTEIMLLCVKHTNERGHAGAWFRSLGA